MVLQVFCFTADLQIEYDSSCSDDYFYVIMGEWADVLTIMEPEEWLIDPLYLERV